jgi:hypothetical protein
MRKLALALAIIGLGLPFFAAAPAQAQPSRTWVSATGDDINPCARTSPCKTFAGALSKTAAGGEINCIDAGDFGGLNITKSMTISCEGGTAGVVATGGFGAITINAAATDLVTLRGLDIDGQGTGGGGIVVGTAAAVHIEKCSMRNFRFHNDSYGIGTSFSTATVFLYVADTVISDNSVGLRLSSGGGYKVVSLKNVVITGSTGDGLRLESSNVYANVNDSIISGNAGSAVNADASSTTVNLVRTTMANNAAALNAAAAGSTIRVSNSDIYNNTFGILIANGATVQSDGTNKHGNSNGGLQVPNASFALY